MDLMNTLLEWVMKFLDVLIPIFSPSQEFITMIDGTFSFIIDILQGAGWLLPLDVIVTCLGVMLLVDNFALISRLGQFVIKMIRG